jgi:tRNA dimethylallyltransferase
VELATRFNGEIINGDAMQMYRGLPIITNQIPVRQRNGIAHHLIGCIGLEEEPWRINHFKRESLRAIREIRSRGKLPILVGGTHYYTQSVLFNETLLDEGESEQEEAYQLSISLSEKWPILEASPGEILQRLKEVDPVMAARWHPNETRKIRRSLEIYLQTGRPASEIYQEQRHQMRASLSTKDALTTIDRSASRPDPGPGQLKFPTLIFWVHTENGKLQSRLDNRVDDMVEQGLVAEAQTLVQYLREKESKGIRVDRTRGVWVSIGFKELEPYFSAQSSACLNAEEAERLKQRCIDSVKISTRQYSRQQLKWIRGKLWNALADSGMTHRLYLLDATDADAWSSSVREPSERIVHAFLNSEPCPDPKELSGVADDILGAKQQALRVDRDSAIKSKVCSVCNTTIQGDIQWERHINGRRHKRTVKSVARRTQRNGHVAQALQTYTEDAAVSR